MGWAFRDSGCADERDEESVSANSVTWKWLAGSLLSLLLLSGGAWVRMVQSEVQTVKEEQKKDRDASANSREKVGVIEERTKRTEEDIKDMKQDLKELLRRTPPR